VAEQKGGVQTTTIGNRELPERWIVAIRVSTEEQSNPGHVSLDHQVEACSNYAEQQGGEVAEVIRYVGSGLDTASFHADVRAAVTRSKAAHLVVWRLDRLGRDHVEAMLISRDLAKVGVTVHSATEPTESSFMRDLLFLMANEESRRISARVRPNMRAQAERGYWVTRAPFGFRIVSAPDGKGKTLEPDETAWAVPELFRRAAEGQPEPKLVAFADTVWPNIHRTTVGRMLKNRAYLGKVVWGRQSKSKFAPIGKRPEDEVVADGLHQALVDEETFNRVKTLFDERRTFSVYTKQNVHLLDGLIFCGKCGAKMRGSSNSAKGRSYRYYGCANGHDHYACDQPRISAERVDEQVWAIIEESYAGTNVTADAALKALGERREVLRQGFGAFRTRLERRCVELKAKIRNALNESLKDNLTAVRRDALERLLKEYEEQLKGMELELQALRPEDEQLRDIEVALDWFMALARAEELFIQAGQDDGVAAARHLIRTSAAWGGVSSTQACQRVARQLIHRVEAEGSIKDGRLRIEWSATAQSILEETEQVLQMARTARPTAGARSAERLR
jgi:site-specific DNA recombinase